MASHKKHTDEENSIELSNLLEQDSTFGNEIGENIGNIETVDWKGAQIKLYRLDYQKIGLVKLQIVATLLMFLVFGLNDQSTGTLVPTLVERYNVSTVVVSNIFITQVTGYMLASFLNEKLHWWLGMRGAMTTAAGLCLIFFSILWSKPSSFFVYTACYLPLGFSIGILDSTGNVLIGNLEKHKNEWMGLMHGLYGAASMVTPPIISYFVKYGRWANFFALPLCVSLLGFIFIIPAFKYETALKYHYVCAKQLEEDQEDYIEEGTGDKSLDNTSFTSLIKNPAVYMYAMYLFVYLGAEVSTGSWLYTYLLTNKSDDRILMSYVTSSYWTGLTVGRLCLGFVTKRKFRSEYHASYAYGLLTFFFYTVLVLVGLVNTNSTWYIATLFLVLFLCGVFIGPLFPNASVVALQALPKNLHIGGVGLAVGLGGCGSALLPYIVGVTLHVIGMQWFPHLCWIMVAAFTLIWCLYPRCIPTLEI